MDLIWELKFVICAILFYLVICLYIVFYLVFLISIEACRGDMLERLVFGPMLIILNTAAIVSFTALWSTALSELLRKLT